MLKLNVPMAMKIACNSIHYSKHRTRDISINDVGKFDKVELSVLLCNDDFMQKLNKEWKGVDAPTDVLSMSQHIPELDLPSESLISLPSNNVDAISLFFPAWQLHITCFLHLCS